MVPAKDGIALLIEDVGFVDSLVGEIRCEAGMSGFVGFEAVERFDQDYVDYSGTGDVYLSMTDTKVCRNRGLLSGSRPGSSHAKRDS